MPILSNLNNNLGILTNKNKEIDNIRYEYIQYTKLIYKKVINNFIYKVYSEDKRVRVFVFNDDIIVGFMSLKKVGRKYQVVVSKVYDEYQRRGIGFNMYEICLLLFKKIISDYCLTEKSFNLWKKLSKKYKTYILTNSNKKLIEIDNNHLGNVLETFQVNFILRA